MTPRPAQSPPATTRLGRARRGLLPLLLLAGLPGLARCAADTVVYVSVASIPDGVRALRVTPTLDGGAARGAVLVEIEDASAPSFRFALDLPAGTAGELAVQVEGLQGEGCAAVSGSGHGVIGDGQQGEIEVALAGLRHQLSVVKAGDGDGTVSVGAGGPSCGPACTSELPACAPVALVASPDAYSDFAGWSGACAGAGPCELPLDGEASVTATFERRQYALSVGKQGEGGGRVTSAPAGLDCGAECARRFPAGTPVQLTATADPVSRFVGWSGACQGAGPCSVTVDTEKSVQAIFAALSFQLDVTRSGGGGGQVTSMPAGIDCGAACGAKFPGGKQVRLAATPDGSSYFAGWSGACKGTDPCTLIITGDVKLGAEFRPRSQSLTVLKDGKGGGAVTSVPAGLDCGATCSSDFADGTVVTLKAMADADSDFAGWSGACAGAGACTVTIKDKLTVSARFVLKQYHLSVTRSGAGTVSSPPVGIDCGAACAADVEAGTLVKLSAAAGPGSVFQGWSAPCSGIGDCIVTMNRAVTITATFKTQALLSVDATARDFGAVMRGSSQDATLTVTNLGEVATGTLSALATGDFSVLSIPGNTCQGALAGGAPCTLPIRFSPSALGARMGSVTIQASPGGSVSAVLTGSGVGPAALQLAPASMNFGTLTVGAAAAQSVTVTNPGGGPTGALSVALTPTASFALESDGCGGKPLPGMATCTLRVKFKPVACEQQDAALTVSGAPGGTVSASLEGKGRMTGGLVCTHKCCEWDGCNRCTLCGGTGPCP